MVLDFLASTDHNNLHKFLDFIGEMVAPIWPSRRCRWPGVPMRHWRTVPHPCVLPGRGLGGGEPDAAGRLVPSNTVTAWIKCILSVLLHCSHKSIFYFALPDQLTKFDNFLHLLLFLNTWKQRVELQMRSLASGHQQMRISAQFASFCSLAPMGSVATLPGQAI